MTLRLSVVVPTYNRRNSLLRLLEALAGQSFPADELEVLVVDDGSSDGSPTVAREMAAAMPYTMRVLDQPHGGPARARNLGVQEARGWGVVFLDDDVVPYPDLLERHAAALGRPEDTTVVVGPMLPPDGWRRPAWIRWEEAMLDKQYRAMLAGAYSCTPRQFYTGNASLPRALFLTAGGFDPRFLRAEDVELAFRLADHGARFVFEPRARVDHYARRSYAAWCRTPRQYGRYDVLMAREKEQPTLENAAREYHGRHVLTRALLRACVGRAWLGAAAVHGLGGLARALDAAGARRAARFALSGSFNLLYWQGVCDELGGRSAVWRLVDAGAARALAGTASPAEGAP